MVMRNMINIILLFGFNNCLAQYQYELIIPSNDNNVEGIFHPAIEVNENINTFTSTIHKFVYGSSASVSKIDKTGKLIFNQIFLDSINPLWIYDAFKTNSGFLLCGTKFVLQDTGSSLMYGKVNYNMDTVWTRVIKTNYNSPVFGKIIQLKNGNIVMVGSDNHNRRTGGTYLDKNNAIILLADSLGNVIKYIHINKPDPQSLEGFSGVTQVSDGSIFACGLISRTTLNGDILLYKFDSIGNILWRKEISSTVYSEGVSIIREQQDGSLLLLGSSKIADVWEHHPTYTLLINIDKEGNINWQKRIMQEYNAGFWNCVEDKNGDFVCGGTIWKDENSNGDGYMYKFSAQGDSIWTRIFSHRDDVPEQFFNIAPAYDGGYYLTGYNWIKGDNSSKAWIVKTDSNGCVVPGCTTAVNKEKEKIDHLFLVYPNPAQDHITIYLNNTDLSQKKYIFRCFDQNGRLLISFRFSGLKKDIDISMLPSSMYFYQIHDGTKLLQNGKFVVE